MRVENNAYQGTYQTTSVSKANAGKFSDVIASFMNVGKTETAAASVRNSDTFERTSPIGVAKRTEPSTYGLTPEQMGNLKGKYSLEQFASNTLAESLSTGSAEHGPALSNRRMPSDQAKNFFADLKQMGVLSEGEYEALSNPSEMAEVSKRMGMNSYNGVPNDSADEQKKIDEENGFKKAFKSMGEVFGPISVPKDMENLITDKELYGGIAAYCGELEHKGLKKVGEIPSLLVKYDAVDVSKVDPTNCTRFEFEVLQSSMSKEKFGDASMRSVLMSFKDSYDRLRSEFTGREIPGENGEKVNWVQEVLDHIEKQDKLSGGRSERNQELVDYMMEMLDYSNGLRSA